MLTEVIKEGLEHHIKSHEDAVAISKKTDSALEKAKEEVSWLESDKEIADRNKIWAARRLNSFIRKNLMASDETNVTEFPSRKTG